MNEPVSLDLSGTYGLSDGKLWYTASKSVWVGRRVLLPSQGKSDTIVIRWIDRNHFDMLREKAPHELLMSMVKEPNK